MICNPANEQELTDGLFELMAPQKSERVCDWVEQNVELPTGEIQGKVRLRKTPYARQILEKSADRRTRVMAMVFSTQSAKSSILIWAMLYRIAREARDSMWVMGNTDQVRAFNKERFQPFVHLCKPVLDLVPRTERGVIDRKWWGFQDQHYRSMVLNFVGAGSATNLKSRPRPVAWFDEVDSYADELGFDSGVINLVGERQKTFSFPLSVLASSPTLRNRGIYQVYDKTDMGQFWVPCPRCEHPILFRMKVKTDQHGDCGLRWWHENEEEAKTDGEWDFKKVRAMAHYKCQECGGMIHDFERESMLNAADETKGCGWLAQNENAPPGWHGFHINSFYSILGNETSLAGIASKFLLATGNRSELKTFVNDWLAEEWDESRGYSLKEVQLEVVNDREISLDTTTAVMSTDIQVKGYWNLVRRFEPPSEAHPHGQSWLVFADFVETEEELDEIAKDYGVAGENWVMDMARKPSQVAKMIIRHGCRGIWGSDTKKFYHKQPDGTRIERPYSVVQFRDPHLGTKWQDRTMDRARYVLFSKHSMMNLVTAMRFSKDPCWHSTVNAHPEYPIHLNSRVQRMEKNRRGFPEWTWHEIHQKNHFLDNEEHVLVRALQLGLVIPPPESDEMRVV